jgi:ERF superfamily
MAEDTASNQHHPQAQGCVSINSPVRKSKQIAALALALSAAQGEFTPVAKSAYDVDNARSYSELGDLIKATRAALAKHGLAVMQPPAVDHVERTVIVTTLLTHKSGQWIESDLELPAQLETDATEDSGVVFDGRTIGAAISLARRYAYAAILELASEPENRTIQDMATLRNESPRINAAQGQNFWRAAKASGKTTEQVNGYLRSAGIEQTEHLTQALFPAAMRWAANAEVEAGKIVMRGPNE